MFVREFLQTFSSVVYLEKSLRIYISDFGVDNYSVFSGEVFDATGLSFSMLLLDSELGLVG